MINPWLAEIRRLGGEVWQGEGETQPVLAILTEPPSLAQGAVLKACVHATSSYLRQESNSSSVGLIGDFRAG